MWATTNDVADRWIGSDPMPDVATIGVVIDDAEDTIGREYTDVQVRIDAGTLPLARVVKVVCRMAIRHLRNPSGVRSVSQGAGSFQQSTTFGGNEPGVLALTDEDRADLSSPSVSRSRAFVIDLMRPAAS